MGRATVFVLQNNCKQVDKTESWFGLQPKGGYSFPEASRNHNGLGEPEQLIIIQPPKTALYECKKFLSPISDPSLMLLAALGTISKIPTGQALGQAFE